MESHLTKKDRQKGVPSSGLRNVEEEIEALLSNKEIAKIEQNIEILKNKQSILEEKLAKLNEFLNRNKEGSGQDLNELGIGIKDSITKCLKILKDEHSNLLIVHELLKRKLKTDKKKVNRGDRSFKFALEELLGEMSHMAPPKSVITELSNNTEFHSFIEDPKILEKVQTQ